MYYKIIPKNHTAPLRKSRSNPNNEIKTTHFSINQSTHSHSKRPLSAKAASPIHENNEQSQNNNHYRKSLPSHLIKPPIPIKQSYTPPINVPASSPYLSANNHSSSSKYIIKPKHAKSNSHDSIPLPSPSINRQKSDELPLGWAKLKDSNGFYYFNVITAEKQRIRPKDDATQSIDGNKPNHKIRKSIPNKPLPSPYSRDIAPSVVTDDMSVAEIEYRKNNGSVVFGAMDKDQFVHQENWDMLVDAIYLNLSPSDYIQVFKALRSIAENLFDEDDKYRILYADNKKVQQRILSRIGGYEFLRGLGFRELTKRKLMCEEADFDVVYTAITAINAKLALLEKHKPLPIIPDHHGINHGNESYDEQRKKKNKIFPMKPHPNVVQMPSPHHQGLRECMNRQFKELHLNKIDHESMQSGIDYDEEEKNEMLHENTVMRDRKISQVTNAVYSDCDDEKAEKLGIDTQVTDAGITETNAYFEKKLNENKNMNRKRSLSFDENMKKQQNIPYFRAVSSPKHGTTVNKNVSFRRKKPSSKQKRSGARKKAMTQHSIDRRSSSVSSPRSKQKKMSMNAIEVEIDRAYLDTQKKLSIRDLEEEDIESLFDDDDDDIKMNVPFGVQSYNKPRDDSYLAMNHNKNNYHRQRQSRDDLAVSKNKNRYPHQQHQPYKYNHHHPYSPTNNSSSHRHTLPPKNMLQHGLLNNNNHNHHSFGQRLYSNSNTNNSNQHRHSQQLSSKSPRSMSYGNALQPNGVNKNSAFIPPQPQPLQFLMPSERKKLAKKQKKKTEKNKTDKIKAFFHSFKSKKNSKYSQEELNKIAKEKEEYRKKHKDDDEDYYAYYGDPAQNGMSASPIPQQNPRMSPNPLSSQFRPAKEMEIIFDDEIIKLTPDSNISCVNLIELALAKRGWSSSMSHLFSLCIKGDSPSSDKEIIATLEDNAKVASFPDFITHLQLSNPKYLIVYKQSN